MFFASPWFLAGLVAAALPVVIHLLNRRAARPLPFPAIELLLATRKRTARRLQVRQILLLASRTLMVAAIPVMLARPYLPLAAGSIATGAPEAVAIVLDDSYSTHNAPAGNSWFELARARAKETVGSLRPEDSAALVLAARRPGGPLTPVDEATFEHARVVDALERAQPTSLPGDLDAAVARAATVLEPSPLSRRRIVVVTDASAVGWDPARRGPDGMAVEIIDVSAGADRANLAVVETRVEPAPSVGPRAYRVVATIANYSDSPFTSVPVELRLEGSTVATGFVELAPRGRAEKVFHHEVEGAGVFAGSVVVTGGDSLPLDDERAFALVVRASVRVLLVNGDPRTVRYRDELFYLAKALAPGHAERARIDPVTVTVDRMDSQPLDRFDVVVLANVAELPPRTVGALQEFVHSGGGLLVTAGARMEPARARLSLGELLPRPPRAVKSVRRVSAEGAAPAGGRPVKLERPRLDHPVFASLGGLGEGGLGNAETTMYLLLEPDPKGESETLLYFDDGAPALVERSRGIGSVMLLTTSVDHDWSDLCIRPGFLPLVQQMVLHLGRSAPPSDGAASLVGEVRNIPLPPGAARSVVISDPHGTEHRAWTTDLGPGRSWRFGATDVPGVYRVRFESDDGEPISSDAFAIGLEPSESDLTRLDDDRLAALERSVGASPGAATSGGGSKKAPPPGSGLWGFVALALIGLVVVEATLARGR